jgi:GNAT superfamily N-acetyltransferase
MKLETLGAKSYLSLAPYDAEIVHADKYISVRIRNNSNFYWGNYIITIASFVDYDLNKARQLFCRAFDLSDMAHCAVLFDNALSKSEVEGDSGSFWQHPNISKTEILVLNQAGRAKDTSVNVKLIETEEEWAQVIELQTKVYDAEHDDILRDLVTNRILSARKKVHECSGVWIGAFVERELVGDLFLSFASNEFGCLDQVETSPKFRRKGIATKLLAFASEMTLRHLGSQRMLVVADIDSAGSATYQRFGFRPIEVVASLEEAFVR